MTTPFFRLPSLKRLAGTLVVMLPLAALAESEFRPAACEGEYPRHVQGLCTNGKDALFWSWTTELVKTDLQGRLLKKVPVADHHGDLCYHNGRVYVATNLGKFNRPAGEADSWVYVYDAETLEEVAKHAVPEVVHGAGGIAYHNERFIVVGGLPPDVNENYAYEYDKNFRFIKRHVIHSGYTLMGIQTITYAEGSWWFGCYGKPDELLRADEDFHFQGKWPFKASLGIAPLGSGQFLIADNKVVNNADGKTKRHYGYVSIARVDEKAGLVLEATGRPALPEATKK